MSSIKDFLHECKQRVVGAVSKPGKPQDSTTPGPQAGGGRWQENCTPDSVLSNFDNFLLNGTLTRGSIFNPREYKKLQEIFTSHASSDSCWDQKSLESYLLTQIPQEEDDNFKTHLLAFMPSLWALTTYFAQWPFHSFTSTPIVSLTFPALLRAIAFLCGRHYKMFRAWHNEDMAFNRHTDQLMLEYIFRALATARPICQQSNQALPDEDTKLSSHRDLLDMLSAAQPVTKYFPPLSRDEPIPIANRLSSPLPELSDLIVPTSVLAIFLELCISTLQQTSKFDPTDRPATLKKKLEAAKIGLQAEDAISFDTFAKWVDNEPWVEKKNRVYTIYDGIALLFNTFPNPQSLTTGKTVNWMSGDEENLRMTALRSLGSTLS